MLTRRARTSVRLPISDPLRIYGKALRFLKLESCRETDRIGMAKSRLKIVVRCFIEETYNTRGFFAPPDRAGIFGREPVVTT